MDTTPHPSTLDTLRTVEFRLNLKGYNVDEVDEYLEKAAVEAEALLEHLRGATERLVHANDRIAQLEAQLQRSATSEAPSAADAPSDAPVAVSDDTLQRTLVLAQKFVDQTKRESEAQAAEVVSRAEERARALVSQAEERARHLADEAEQRLRQEVSRLEGQCARLSADAEKMARHIEEERSRIRTSLTQVLKFIDDSVQPSESLKAIGGRQHAAPAPPSDPRHNRPAEAGAPAPAASEVPHPVESGISASPSAEPVDLPATPRLRSVGSTGTDDLFEAGRRAE